MADADAELVKPCRCGDGGYDRGQGRRFEMMGSGDIRPPDGGEGIPALMNPSHELLRLWNQLREICQDTPRVISQGATRSPGSPGASYSTSSLSTGRGKGGGVPGSGDGVRGRRPSSLPCSLLFPEPAANPTSLISRVLSLARPGTNDPKQAPSGPQELGRVRVRLTAEI